MRQGNKTRSKQTTLRKKKTSPAKTSTKIAGSDEKLLDLRICDLDLNLDDTWIQPLVEQVWGEVADCGIRLKPHCWLSDEWYSPDGIPGIAIPFYLAHPRLMKLEQKQMLEVEGGTKKWCLKILRHETGHAVDTAFRLHRRKSYKQIFGNYFAPYPEHYRPKPNSKSYVNHLEPWYSQSHPAEDFAETFAVWLNPKSDWKRRYKGWKAIKKLEFVDDLIKQVQGKSAPVKSRAKVDPAHRLKITLRDYYKTRHERFGFECPRSFADDLRKLFGKPPQKVSHSGKTVTAATFLRQNRIELCRLVSEWTGEYRYNINLVLLAMINQSEKLELYATGNRDQLQRRAMVMLTVHVMNYLHGSNHRVSL